MNDVLRVYQRPFNPKKPVICIDEKSTQLSSDVRKPKGMRPGQPAKFDYEYTRRGTANIFVAVEPKRGRHLMKVTTTRKAHDFAEFLNDLSKIYRYASKIHLVMDNLNTHCEKSLIKRYGPRRGAQLWSRFRVHYTPKHASWLNQAECEIGLFSREVLAGQRISDRTVLRDQTQAWTKDANKRKRTIRWTFTTAKAKEKFKLPEH